MIAATDMAAVHAVASHERAWSEAEFAALLALPGVFAVGDARAFALVRVIAGEAELLTIATRPEHRRQGLAHRLMEQWHERAQAMGADVAFLEVAADNDAARTLYAACGYAEAGRRRGYYRRSDGTACDALLMRRALSPT